MGQTLWLAGILIFSAASLLGSLEFYRHHSRHARRVHDADAHAIATTVKWAWLVTAILSLAGVQRAAGGILLLLDRSAGTSFFIPGNLVLNGELQGHRRRLAAFVAAPSSGFLAIPRCTSRFCRAWVWSRAYPGQFLAKAGARVSRHGFRAMRHWLSGIARWSGATWRCSLSEMNPYSGLTFSLLTVSIGVPSAIKTFNWLGTLWGGRICCIRADAVRHRLRNLFHHRRPFWDFPGAASRRRYHAARHILRGGAPAYRDGRGGDIWKSLRRFWFPKNGRAMDEPLGKLHLITSAASIASSGLRAFGVAANCGRCWRRRIYSDCSRCTNSSPRPRSSPARRS